MTHAFLLIAVLTAGPDKGYAAALGQYQDAAACEEAKTQKAAELAGRTGFALYCAEDKTKPEEENAI